MNKKSKLVFICGLALAMMTVATEQTVKADTATDAQVQTVDTDVQNTQAISQATQSTPVQTQTTQDAQVTTTQEDTQQPVQQAAAQQATDVATTNAAAEQATTDTTAASISQVKGVVTTGDHFALLYKQDGSQVADRALAANTPWLTDEKLAYNGGTYYRVSTEEFVKGSDVTLDYGVSSDGIVRVTQNGAVNYTRNETGFVKSGQPNFGANSVWKYSRLDNSNDKTFYQIGNNTWVNSDDSTTAPAYQNPNGWLQIQNTQIQPGGGAVGYELYNGVEGIKTWLVRRYFGYSNVHTVYDGSVAASVRSLQARKGLPVTGNVDLATWKAMGFVESTWYGIDSYVAPLQTNITSSRSDHIEAMINQAYKYIGQSWITGAASSPDYGVDCSGLVTQALYASGVDSAPITAIQHAQPGNEWNSRDYWADERIPHVNFNDRQRGDLIFFTDPSTGIIWHVGILLDPSTMIESWPFAVQVHSIYGGRGNIAGVKRVFS
ncbi:peptidoglycan-binding protein [Companilactobacillus kimchiensis]|uniref:NlpC/P60 domain-containing protein n=1 Tax=Companilactobacillus kimchiensis TaxID=993692 RepID=A0A0R2LLM9_9LACO|nr:peptidoglycan-binding protein [Companilactobacillus kimchiensis]KRN99847.1 hypothetical protein IV57_GL002179 [Companilactobacillus kimchiensis]